MLVTGNRISDSKILSSISFFKLSEKEHKTLKIELRKEISPPEILGKIDLKQKYSCRIKNQICLDSLLKNGMVISWIEPDKEPTKHIFKRFKAVKSELNNWGGYFVFLTTNLKRTIISIIRNKWTTSKILFGADIKSEILSSVVEGRR